MRNIFFIVLFGLITACSEPAEEALPVPDIVDPPVAANEVPVPPPVPNSAEGAGLPQPPAPPAPPPSIVDSVKAIEDDELQGPVERIRGEFGPREALFEYVITSYRQSEYFGARPICLRQVDETLLESVASRHSRVFSESACGWSEGGVILNETGEPALFIHAKVDCADRACAAEGGATYGNLGGEGHGYLMRRVTGGWTIQKSGIMWIS